MAGRTPGPMPKKDSERTRRNVPVNGPARQGQAMPAKAPNARRDWDDRAKKWFNSLKRSGQSLFYQQSDWEYALIAGDVLNHIYHQNFYKSAILVAEFNKMAGVLGTTEADRRSALRVELETPKTEEETVAGAARDKYMTVIRGDFGGESASA